MPIFITVAKKHQNSVTVTSFHVDQIEHGLSCLLTMELLAYVFVLYTMTVKQETPFSFCKAIYISVLVQWLTNGVSK
jgi:hypothetical protein